MLQLSRIVPWKKSNNPVARCTFIVWRGMGISGHDYPGQGRRVRARARQLNLLIPKMADRNLVSKFTHLRTQRTKKSPERHPKNGGPHSETSSRAIVCDFFPLHTSWRGNWVAPSARARTASVRSRLHIHYFCIESEADVQRPGARTADGAQKKLFTSPFFSSPASVRAFGPESRSAANFNCSIKDVRLLRSRRGFDVPRSFTRENFNFSTTFLEFWSTWRSRISANRRKKNCYTHGQGYANDLVRHVDDRWKYASVTN